MKFFNNLIKKISDETKSNTIHILELFKEKNHFLKKFFLHNEVHIQEFNTGNFENVEHFYDQRESLLELIEYINLKIEKTNFSNLPEIEKIIKNNEILTQDILKQDIEIMSLIENAKSNIIKELQKLKTGRQAISNYKSPQISTRRISHGSDFDSNKE